MNVGQLLGELMRAGSGEVPPPPAHRPNLALPGEDRAIHEGIAPIRGFRRRQVIAVLATRSAATIRDIAQGLGITEKNARMQMWLMKRDGLAESPRIGFWKLSPGVTESAGARIHVCADDA